nr:hypothetical protein GTC16762_33730 [Pigmentibacter ruber]
MLLRYKIIICIVTLVAVFFLGRSTTREKTITVTETKIEKVEDTEATARAVEQAIKKTRSEFKQRVFEKKTKKPDGTIETQKQILNESVSESDTSHSNALALNVVSHQQETIALKSALKRFSLNISVSVEKVLHDDMKPSEFLELAPILSANFRYRLLDDYRFWTFGALEYNTINHNKKVEAGISYEIF